MARMDVATIVSEIEKFMEFSVSEDGIVTPRAANVDGLEPIPGKVIDAFHAQFDEVVAFIRARAAAAVREDAEYSLAFCDTTAKCGTILAGSPGALLWLRQKNPALYDDITRRLPDLAQQMWASKAPIAIFRRTLADIERATAASARLHLVEKGR